MRAAVLAYVTVLCVVAPAWGTEIASKSSEVHAPVGVSAEPAKLAEPPPPKLIEPSAKLHESSMRPPHGHVCLTQAEAREKIAARRLNDPIHALRLGRQQGEALRVRLCRWKPDEFVYEIFVLKRDGRLVRVYMNAENGQLVGALGEAERK